MKIMVMSRRHHITHHYRSLSQIRSAIQPTCLCSNRPSICRHASLQFRTLLSYRQANQMGYDHGTAAMSDTHVDGYLRYAELILERASTVRQLSRRACLIILSASRAAQKADPAVHGAPPHELLCNRGSHCVPPATILFNTIWFHDLML